MSSDFLPKKPACDFTPIPTSSRPSLFASLFGGNNISTPNYYNNAPYLPKYENTEPNEPLNLKEKQTNMDKIRFEDLINNPSTRIPVCFCLDISPSMSGKSMYGADPSLSGVPIDELNKGLRLMFEELRADDRTRFAVEAAVVTFSHKGFLVQDFETIDQAKCPQLMLDMVVGGSSLGSGVNMALDLLEKRKTEYKETGVLYYQPWLVIITDGDPTDDIHLAAAKRIKPLVESRKMAVFPVGVGSNVGLERLAVLSPKAPPLRLKGLKFAEFFQFLSASIQQVSVSGVDEEIRLDTSNLGSWAKL